MSKLSQHVWLSFYALGAVFFLFSFVGFANAQTQASCQLSRSFSSYFSVGNAARTLTPRNVNDYATVVGDGFDDTNFIEMGFFQWPDRNYTYYQHTSNGQPVQTFLYDRDNTGTIIGITLPGKTPMPFMLKGSTYTPLTMTIGGTTYNNFYPFGMNRWGTIVGMYRDSSGTLHGFERYSDGKAVRLNYPGAAETVANGINDNGTIVGYYSKNLPPNEWKHGFIYNNGQWASVSYPNKQTTLQGISNANLIVATTLQGSNALNSYIYVNGVFKKIVIGPGTYPTYAFGISPGKGLITGFTHFSGWVATCK